VDTHKYTQAPLTINLQPIAQLYSVAMANILSPESSAAKGGKQRGSHFEHVMENQDMCEERKGESESERRI